MINMKKNAMDSWKNRTIIESSFGSLPAKSEPIINMNLEEQDKPFNDLNEKSENKFMQKKKEATSFHKRALHSSIPNRNNYFPNTPLLQKNNSFKMKSNLMEKQSLHSYSEKKGLRLKPLLINLSKINKSSNEPRDKVFFHRWAKFIEADSKMEYKEKLWKDITIAKLPPISFKTLPDFKPISKPHSINTISNLKQTNTNITCIESQKENLLTSLFNLRLANGYQSNRAKTKGQITFQKGYHHHYVKDLFNGNLQIEHKYLVKKARILGEEYEVSNNDMNFFYYKFVVQSVPLGNHIPSKRFFYNKDEINWIELDSEASNASQHKALKFNKKVKIYSFCDSIVAYSYDNKISKTTLLEINECLKSNLKEQNIKILEQNVKFFSVCACANHKLDQALHETITLDIVNPSDHAIIVEIRWISASSYNIHCVNWSIEKALENNKLKRFHLPVQIDKILKFCHQQPNIQLKLDGFTWMNKIEPAFNKLKIVTVRTEENSRILIAYKFHLLFKLTTSYVRVYDISSISTKYEVKKIKKELLDLLELPELEKFESFC